MRINRTLCAALAVGVALSQPASAEVLSFKEARKLLPRANARSDVSMNVAALPQSDLARISAAQQAPEDILTTLANALPVFGALAVSPDHGLFVDWLQGAGGFHSPAAARAAARAQCDGAKPEGAAECVIIIEVAPRGASEEFSLNAEANSALRKAYRRMDSPKAFAISDRSGHFGFDRGDGGRALDACERASKGAGDCRIVVQD